MGENSKPNTSLGLEGASGDKPRDEEHSPRLGEMYQDINAFTETKRKIETLMRLRKALGEENDNFAALSEELKHYRLLAMEALDRLFSNYTPNSNAH